MSGAPAAPGLQLDRTLLIHLGQLGDAVMALPAAQALRSACGNAGLTVLTSRGADDIFRMAGFERIWVVDRARWQRQPLRAAIGMPAMVLRLRRERFALSVDLHSFKETNLLAWAAGIPARIAMLRATRSWPRLITHPPPLDDYHAHLADRYCRVLTPLGIEVAVRVPQLEPPAAARSRMATRWSDWPPAGADVLGLCPGAGHAWRRWPAANFAGLAARMQLHAAGGLRIAVFAGPEEDIAALRPLIDSPGARLMRGLGIDELAAALAACRLVVSNPTGPSHIAAAVGARVVSLGEVEQFDPRGRVEIVRAPGRIDRITVDQAMAAARRMWDR